LRQPSKPEQRGQQRVFGNFLLHFRPRSVPERTLKLTLTWGLGVVAVVMVFLLLLTGLLLKFTYSPFPGSAYDSVTHLVNQVPFGRLLRNVHHWAANGLMLVVFLHFLRVFYTGAFAPPRQLNWVIGLVLFSAIILSDFTGYLLPWDQIAFWAITISTSMLDYIPVVGAGFKEWLLGGSEPGPQALMNFYAIHTAILPVVLLFCLSFHFWRIRKAGGLVIPRSAGEDPSVRGEMVDAMPHQITREVSLALLVFASVLVVAMLVDAPLAEQANPGLSPNPTKAPWYFMGVQELLMHFHPVFATLVIPVFLVSGLISVAYISYDTNTSGIWFCSPKGLKMTGVAAIFAGLATVAAVLLDEHVIRVNQAGPPDMVSHGLLPFASVLAICAGFYYLVKKAFSATNNEAVQALFTLLMTAFVTLTLIGIWFRGAGMKLEWAGS